VKVALLSRFVDDVETKATLEGLADGTVDVVIGTHRLLSESVSFKILGLLVVDEEQRFGVTHKESIKSRSVGVDVLTLSASPIPRTLEMAFTGIRDLSMITTPPADRRPILTHVGEYNEPAVVEAIRRELLREGQVFFVHNRVTDIDQVARRLGQLVPDARVAIAHGQMDEGSLERVMIDFWERRYDVLVCTTIVESGIDLPSVNTLIVDRAERLGLGQLHQLRGRVGTKWAARLRLPLPSRQIRCYPRPPTRGCARSATTPRSAAASRSPCATSRSVARATCSVTTSRAPSRPSATTSTCSSSPKRSPTPEVFVVPEITPINLDVPGEAHLPKDYVEADDARLEAYRRLASVTTLDELEDLRIEWVDRYGALPAPAIGLLELAQLRLVCLEYGVTSVIVMPARVGVRSRPIVRFGPVLLALSQQLRVRRAYGSSAYNESTHEFRVERAPSEVSPAAITALVHDVHAATTEGVS
jgi:transcription-repair coupling factor (superfamily II helicase)